MVINICPRCQKRFATMEKAGDYICDCSQSTSSEALKNEDIKITGGYNDFGGSADDTNFWRGAENKLQGTRGGIEGNKTHDLTSRGNIKTVTRSRAYLQYLELDENGKI